ncbi:Regulator of G protein signaling [Achlya hypogyna]|uniref:Regulator of G protein signaling n=1 Tax=Achlya hypogyna TaxID=1202772 RepID=A0A1V9Y5E8_ACHHY|nr:Regulator of G protein signaling [Achlya hypogyna]
MGAAASVEDSVLMDAVREEYAKGEAAGAPDEAVFEAIQARLRHLEDTVDSARATEEAKDKVVIVAEDPGLHGSPSDHALGRLTSLSYVHLDTTQERGKQVSQSLKAIPTTLKQDHTKYRRPTITRELVDDLSMAFTIDVLVDPATFKLLLAFSRDVPFAVDRLQFWADVQNYRSLPSAQYTDRMLRKIYEKFVSPASPTPICVPTQMLAEIRALYESPAGIQSAGVFSDAQALCKRDLEKDVFPRFRKHVLFQNMVSLGEVAGAPLSCVAQPDALPGDVDDRYSFDAVLNDENKLRFFKTYCIESRTAENLVFYCEVEECKRLPNQSYIQARARKIFDTYIKEGAKRHINLTASMHEEMATKSEGTFDPIMYHDAQYLVVEYVRLELWGPFSHSPEYLAFTQQQTSSAAGPQHWDPYHPAITEEQMRILMAQLDETEPELLYDRAMAIPVTALANVGKASSVQVDPLVMLLHDKIAHRAFKAFLVKRHKEHCVAFIDEVDEFNTLPGIEFMHHTAKKLYKKYVSDAAKLQVDMSTKLRQDIVAKLSSPTIDMFKPVVHHVKQGLLRDSLLRYFKSPTFAELKLTGSDPQLASEITTAVTKGSLEMPHLDVILANPKYVGNFKKFLRLQHCVENLIFYEEVEEFRRLPSYQIVLRSAKKIIDKYININTSRHPIRLPDHLHDAMVANLDQADKTYFTDAVQEVMDSLRTQDVPDFLDSSAFLALVGSWALMDEQYAIRQLIGDLELAYFRHRLYLSQAKPKTAR